MAHSQHHNNGKHNSNRFWRKTGLIASEVLPVPPLNHAFVCGFLSGKSMTEQLREEKEILFNERKKK